MKRLVQSPAFWLYASQLLARGYGFLITLAIARLCGQASVGGYSAMLITCSSPTAPMALAMANSTSLMATEHGHAQGMQSILWANARNLVISGLVAGMGVALLLWASGLEHVPGVAPGFQWLAAMGLVVGMLLAPVTMGMAHGMGLSRSAAQIVSGVQFMGMLAVYPMVLWGGVTAALGLTAVVTMGPLLVGLLGRRPNGAARSEVPRAALRQEAAQRFRQALPNVLSTVINNATNWLACIYLANRFHGHDGVAAVAISLQWLALVQLPVSSYSGRLMYDLGVANQSSRLALAAAMKRAALLCVGVTATMTVLIGAVSPFIADLYKLDRETFVSLLVVGGGAATLSGFTVVYERVFFCLSSQRPWLVLSTLAYLCQLALTFVLIPHSILAVPIGNAVGVGLLAIGVHVYLKRAVFKPSEAL